jgi:hypothetical protein
MGDWRAVRCMGVTGGWGGEGVFSVCYIAISFIYIMIISGMKAELDDSNYEAMISKLAKGSIDDKAHSLKKLLFLY